MREIRFSQETKTWLGGLAWPPSAYGDFDQIKKHNEKVKVNCNKDKPNG